MSLFIASFLAGILTILAPCILPVIPVVVGGGIAEKNTNKKHVLIILASLGLSIFLFTLLLKATTTLLGVPQVIWQIITSGILIFIGLSYVFPFLWEKISLYSGGALSSQKLFAKANTSDSTTLKPILIGAALGPVFSSCSPTYAFIVAAILPVSFTLGLVYLITYIVGLLMILAVVVLAGQKLIKQLGWALNPHGIFRRSVGILLIIIGILVLTGGDKAFQSYILESGLYDPIESIEASFRG